MSQDANVGLFSFSNGFSNGFANEPLFPVVLELTVNDSTVVITEPSTSAYPETNPIEIIVPETEVEFITPNWTDCIPTTNYFQKDTACYDREKEMIGCQLQDMINTFAVPMTYYLTDYNTSYDQVFGEDEDRTILRSFTVNATYELPEENEMVSIYGIEGLDSFKMYIAINHFTMASTYSGDTSGVWPSETPKVGDIIQAQYSEIYYEVLDVKNTEGQFLQAPHAYDFIVRPYRDIHLNLSATIETDPISAFTDQDDYLAINDIIDTEKADIIITSADDTILPNDPFGGW